VTPPVCHSYAAWFRGPDSCDIWVNVTGLPREEIVQGYVLKLVRSLQLNPLRTRIVADMEGVAKYAYSEHVALVGTRAYGWQDTEAVLTQFGTTRRRA
jgi:hypothetical protein